MDFFSVKRHFRELSGRYDLADDDTTGIVDFLINEASRNLDRLTEHQKTWGVHFEELAIDSFKVDIPFCRAVKEVWATDSSNNKWQLEKKNIQDLIAEYLASPPDSGTPLYYSPTITRRIPEGVDISAFASYLTYMDVSTDLDQDFNAVVVLPPTDEAILIEVRGFFYSKQLSEDEDENYWTVVHPLTLLKATMRELEIFNQNQTKVDGWDKAINVDLTNINKDLVSEIIAEVDEIDG